MLYICLTYAYFRIKKIKDTHGKTIKLKHIQIMLTILVVIHSI